MIDDPPAPLCFGIAPKPEYQRLGKEGLSKGPSMRPVSISFLRLSSIMLGCYKAELRCLVLSG